MAEGGGVGIGINDGNSLIKFMVGMLVAVLGGWTDSIAKPVTTLPRVFLVRSLLGAVLVLTITTSDIVRFR